MPVLSRLFPLELNQKLLLCRIKEKKAFCRLRVNAAFLYFAYVHALKRSELASDRALALCFDVGLGAREDYLLSV